MKISYYALFFLPLLIACQSNQHILVAHNTSETNLYLDEHFQSKPPLIIETAEEVFQLDDEMRAMVRKKLTGNLSTPQKARALIEHLFKEENIGLSYNVNANLTASQAYHSKVANCMSLTIMAYALADEAGMNVSFRDVAVPEYWIRNGQYNMMTGHVNLRILNEEKSDNRIIWSDSETKIDFDPYIAKKIFPSKPIKKRRLLAMFYTNKGAEALANYNHQLAYKYLKAATLTDNRFSSAWGNLGVLYKLSGYEELAETAYRHAINLKHNNLTSLGNLALLLKAQNRISEAQPIEKHLVKLRIENPYYHALLGNEALLKKSYDTALKHYKKAIQLDNNQHEFYFGLAKVYFNQGELTLSKRAMKKAIGHSKAKRTQGQYIAKLNFLNDVF